MNKYSVAILKGDGIGEVQAEYASRILQRLSDKYGFSVAMELLPFGKMAYTTLGSAFPDETKNAVLNSDSALLFAVDSSSEKSLVYMLRQDELYLFPENGHSLEIWILHLYEK